MRSTPFPHTSCLKGSRQILFDPKDPSTAAAVGRGVFTADRAAEAAQGSKEASQPFSEGLVKLKSEVCSLFIRTQAQFCRQSSRFVGGSCL